MVVRSLIDEVGSVEHEITVDDSDPLEALLAESLADGPIDVVIAELGVARVASIEDGIAPVIA